MSSYTRRERDTSAPAAAPSSTSRASGTGTTNSDANMALAEGKDPQDVVLYLTLNSTTHHKDELPEAMSALKLAEKQGLGNKQVMPISDTYWDGTTTHGYVLGNTAASKVTFWTDDTSLKQGQIRIGNEPPIMLGTEGADAMRLLTIQQNWYKALVDLGMVEEYATKVVTALLGDREDPKALASGDGATNELIQFAFALYRSEIGEIDATDVVLSGHHWSNDRDNSSQVVPGVSNQEAHIGGGIWGEDRDHNYDYLSSDQTSTGGDFFAFEDIRALKYAFPVAFSKVRSVQLAACNTDSLGMKDAAGNEQSTNEFLQDVFPNIERASYWSGLAPTAKQGANTNGEFLLDGMKDEAGQANAWKDAGTVSTPGGSKVHRSSLDENGKLADIDVKRDSKSYKNMYSDRLGLRGADKLFTKRADLKNYLYQGGALPKSIGQGEGNGELGALDPKMLDQLFASMPSLMSYFGMM